MVVTRYIPNQNHRPYTCRDCGGFRWYGQTSPLHLVCEKCYAGVTHRLSFYVSILFSRLYDVQ